MKQRRDFLLGAGSLIALSASRPDMLFAANVPNANEVGLSTGMSKAKFEALLNESFYVYTENQGVVALRLVAVTETLLSKKALSRSARVVERFTLTFRGSALPPLAAGLYEIDHWVAGRTSIYLEPKKTPEHYAAIFALLR
ncbi:MAG: DUF6916 family protein [Burkholderiales bacterium]